MLNIIKPRNTRGAVIMRSVVTNIESNNVRSSVSVGNITSERVREAYVPAAESGSSLEPEIRNGLPSTEANQIRMIGEKSAQIQRNLMKTQEVGDALEKIQRILGKIGKGESVEKSREAIDGIVKDLQEREIIKPSGKKKAAEKYEIDLEKEKQKLADITAKGLKLKNAVYSSAGGVVMVNGNVDTVILSGSQSANAELSQSMANEAMKQVAVQQANVGDLQAKLANTLRQIATQKLPGQEQPPIETPEDAKRKRKEIADQLKNLLPAQKNITAQQVGYLLR